MNLAFGTPTMIVRGNRGVAVRTLTYNRASADASLDERIERTAFGPLGFVASRIDARLFSASAGPNFSYVASVSGQVVRRAGVDTGTQLALADADGRPVWSRDARGTVSTWTYDPLGRPLTASETASGGSPAVREAWCYGEAEPDAAKHNLRGQCARHYEPAGRLAWSGFRLSGQPLAETRTLLARPDAEPDWQGDEAAWASALEAVTYPTGWTHEATGAWLTQTDAKGNVQAQSFDVAGRLVSRTLTLAGGAARPVLAAIAYGAAGQVLSETAGNGMVSAYGYEPETRRLVRLTVTRPAQSGRAAVLQDLYYDYDPVGNVASVRDAAQSARYWRNQRVEAARSYTYDALYQLISATGRETVSRGRQGSTLPPAAPLPSDDTVYTAYTRRYAYDRGGNLTQIAHQGAATYTQAIVVSATRNRALMQNDQGSLTPADVDDGSWFDAAGNQQRLLPARTQPLAWNGRNRLAGVTLVARSGQPDGETYQYGANGRRVRKCASAQTSGTTRTTEAIYLPGLTLRVTRADDGQTVKVVEALNEIGLDAGQASARALHWEIGRPSELANDLTRYGVGDLIGSVGLELDDEADLISREEYYPYGGTAVWSARSEVEADTKFVRYSGKERDATGLYDYGWRSYQPWLGRWLNPDPAGIVDGLNLFRMVGNNPISFSDPDGRMLKACFGLGKKKEKVAPFVPSELERNLHTLPGLPWAYQASKNDRLFMSNFVDTQDIPISDYLYRSHNISAIDDGGLRRRTRDRDGNELPETSGDDYLAEIFMHSGGIGSAGRVLSLSPEYGVAKEFFDGRKSKGDNILTRIRASNDKNSFLSIANILKHQSIRLIGEKKVLKRNVAKAILHLQGGEYETFYLKGDIPAELVDVWDGEQTKNGVSAPVWIPLRDYLARNSAILKKRGH